MKFTIGDDVVVAKGIQSVLATVHGKSYIQNKLVQLTVSIVTSSSDISNVPMGMQVSVYHPWDSKITQRARVQARFANSVVLLDCRPRLHLIY